MNNWVLTAQHKIEVINQQRQTVGAGQVKVRITHVLLTNYDALCYSGDKKVPYPRTIGRNAIGIVTETGDNCYGIKVGARVYLNPLRACGRCYECKCGNHANCLFPLVAVQDFDGFLRDFIVCNYNEVAVIPDTVDDMLALCIENVAVAENIFDRLNLSTGNCVAIIGAGFLGSIIAQIALYHKLVPIIVDTYSKNVERLKRSGAFFSFEADDNLMNNIENATSGTLCDAAIYTSDCKLPATIAARVLARNKDLVLGGFSTINFSLETAPLIEKNMRIYSVSDGYGYTETAINMLTHGAVDLTNFEKEVIKNFDVEDLLDDIGANSARNAKMTVLKLVL